MTAGGEDTDGAGTGGITEGKDAGGRAAPGSSRPNLGDGADTDGAGSGGMVEEKEREGSSDPGGSGGSAG